MIPAPPSGDEVDDLSEFYFYKVRNDDGGAPCVSERLLTLAICKPRTRKSASIGDWIFGFGGKRLGERLIYIAEVTTKFVHGDYYRLSETTGRADRIYEWDGPALRCRENARFHPNGEWAHKDIGEFPSYRKANVLMSSNFRYFGSTATDEWKSRYPSLRARLEALRQGERVNHSDKVHADLIALREWIWSAFDDSILGQPSGDPCDACDPCSPRAPDPDDDDD